MAVLACIACGGPAGPPVAATSVARIDFGTADCGASSGQTIELQNDGDSDLHWSITGDAVFAGTSGSGTVGPRSASSILLSVAIPETASPGQPFTGSVRIATDDPLRPEIVIPVSAVARGAVLEMPSTLDVGVTPVGFTTPPASLKVRNTGNVAVEVTFGKPSAPSFAFESSTLTVEPNKSSETLVRYTASTPETATASTALTIRGPVCGARPASIALKALGTGGVLGFSPGVLDHGLVDCGTTTPNKNVTFVNNGNVNMSITVTRKSDAKEIAKDAVIAPFGGTFTLGSFVSVPQTSAVTPGLYDDEWVVTADEKTYSIPIKGTARGAILAFGSGPAFGDQAVDVITTKGVSVTNSGNVPTTVSGASVGNVFKLQPTFVPVGTSFIGVDTLPDLDRLGVVDTRSITVSQTAPQCGLDPLSASVRAFDRAVDATAGAYGVLCIVGSNKRVYCSGGLAVGGIGYNGQSTTPRLTTVTADGVRLGGSMLCSYLDSGPFRNVSCWFGQVGPNAQYSISTTEPGGTELVVAVPDYQDVDGHVCVIRPNGTLECLGANLAGEWGTGSVGPSFTPSWTQAMGGVSPVSSYAGYVRMSSAAYGFAVVNGTIRAAGTNEGYSLGNFSDIGSGPVAVPRAVDQITDAVSVSSWPGGGCVVHVGGLVTCWGGSNPSHFAVAPALPDIISFGGGPLYGCALRTGGLVSCVNSNNQTFVPIGNIGTPVKVFRPGFPGKTVIVESDGRVSVGALGSFARVPGFD